jgi:DNA modification methylase
VSRADLYVGDCVEVLKTLPDESIDFTIFSPPYDSLKAYEGYTFDLNTFKALQAQIYRLSRPGAVCVVVVNDAIKSGNRSCSSLRYVLAMQDYGWFCHDLLPWIKRSTPYIARGRLAQAWELVAVMSKGKPKYVNLPTKPNGRAGAIMKRKNGTSYIVKAEGVVSNIVEIDVGKNKTRLPGEKQFNHPAPYPPILARSFIESWCPPSGVCLDPLAGISSTGVGVALAGGNRSYIGVDCSSRYINWSRERLRALGSFSEVEIHGSNLRT